MDIILELADYVLLDPLYAYLLPAPEPLNPWHSTQWANATTATFSSLREGATAVPAYSYTPSTKYLSLEPTRYAYMSQVSRDNVYRQAVSLFFIGWIFGFLVYAICSGCSYAFVFDKTTFEHPKFLKNQIRQEIIQTMKAMPGMAVLMAPCFLLEVRGYTKMYDTFDDAPFPWYNIIQFPFFILFTDLCIYWIHRGLHHPLIYKRLHKAHHKWIMPTPFASHAFHPVDGFAQSIPYHLFAVLFPLQKHAYVLLFVFINFWTIFIHDGEYVANSPIINGAACHTMHHLYFNYNYGQFTTLWDRLGGSYRKPNDELFRRETKMGKEEWQRQVKEMEKVLKEVEGDDDRAYGDEAAKIQKKLL